MRKIFLMFFMTCSLVTFAAGQRKSRNSGILVDKNKPAVFISFLRSKDIEPDDATDERKNFFYKITNNTRWNIWLSMSGVSKKEYGDASLYYTIESQEDRNVRYGSISCHVCSINPLGSGRSIVFSIPASYATNDALMRIAYSFDWERENEFFVNEGQGNSFSTHFVEYHFNKN